MRAAVPEFVRWNGQSEYYWARGAKFRAAFLPQVDGQEPVWSDWSAEVRSTRDQQGVDPVLRVSNAGLDQVVLFQRKLAACPLEEQGEYNVWLSDESLERVSVTEFAGSPTPVSLTVRVVNGDINWEGVNVGSGRCFYINRNNTEYFVVVVNTGVWSVSDLCARISSEFAKSRGSLPRHRAITGVAFAAVPGTPYLRCYLDPTSDYPHGPEAEFRVLSYTPVGSNPNRDLQPYWFGRADYLLNSLLGFGWVPGPGAGAPPQVSGLQGQVGMWPPYTAGV
jgi:hypothetical protein